LLKISQINVNNTPYDIKDAKGRDFFTSLNFYRIQATHSVTFTASRSNTTGVFINTGTSIYYNKLDATQRTEWVTDATTKEQNNFKLINAFHGTSTYSEWTGNNYIFQTKPLNINPTYESVQTTIPPETLSGNNAHFATESFTILNSSASPTSWSAGTLKINLLWMGWKSI